MKSIFLISTTKIMTAILALEFGNPEDVVKVSASAVGIEGSSLYLVAGEEISLSDLVYGLILASGNDAAFAIAQHIAGDVDTFAGLMNEKAHQIGAMSTHFVNPHGLDNAEHYTTAYDLALITRYALSNPKFAEIAASKTKRISWQGKASGRSLSNHNRLLSMYSEFDGVKTGFTKATGRCLVSSATVDGHQVIAVTLNAPDDWRDHKAMVDYAFANFKFEKLMEKGTVLGSVKVKNGEADKAVIVAADDYYMPLREGEHGKAVVTPYLPEEVSAPLAISDPAGYVGISIAGTEYIAYYAAPQTDIVFKKPMFQAKSAFSQVFKLVFKQWLRF